MLDAAELADLRADMEDSFPDSCIIRTYTVEDDGMGGEIHTPVDSDPVACVLEQITARETTTGDRPVAVTTWQVRLPYGTALDAEAQLVIGGEVFEVADINTPESEALEVLVQVRKTE